MKTRDRIIQASLQLFNEHGERSTTTNHIAAHLGMSPGNLYYHFRNKEDIILSIFQQYEQHLESAFQPYHDEALNIELLIKYFDAVFYALWQFRFVYTNLADILSRDEQLKARYLKVQTRLQDHVCKLLTQLCNDGFLKIESAHIPALADTVKMIVSFWISYQLTQTTMKSITKSAIYDGVLRLLMLFRAYATETSFETINRIEQHYLSLAQSN